MGVEGTSVLCGLCLIMKGELWLSLKLEEESQKPVTDYMVPVTREG